VRPGPTRQALTWQASSRRRDPYWQSAAGRAGHQHHRRGRLAAKWLGLWAISGSCGGVGGGGGCNRWAAISGVGLGLADRGQVPQRGQDEDGDPDQHQGGDRGDGVQPAGEGLPGDRQQRLGQLVGERSGCGRGAGEAVAGGGGGRWDIGGEVVGELGVADGGADAAQDRDAQRVAELVAGLGQARRRPGLLRRAEETTRLVPSATSGPPPTLASTTAHQDREPGAGAGPGHLPPTNDLGSFQDVTIKTLSGGTDGASVLMVMLASVDAAPLRSPTWA
jgi:hypothetical protein